MCLYEYVASKSAFISLQYAHLLYSFEVYISCIFITISCLNLWAFFVRISFFSIAAFSWNHRHKPINSLRMDGTPLYSTAILTLLCYLLFSYLTWLACVLPNLIFPFLVDSAMHVFMSFLSIFKQNKVTSCGKMFVYGPTN